MNARFRMQLASVLAMSITGKIVFFSFQKLREGVVKDFQRQQMKKVQNMKDLQTQATLTRVLRAERDKEMRSNEAGS